MARTFLSIAFGVVILITNSFVAQLAQADFVSRNLKLESRVWLATSVDVVDKTPTNQLNVEIDLNLENFGVPDCRMFERFNSLEFRLNQRLADSLVPARCEVFDVMDAHDSFIPIPKVSAEQLQSLFEPQHNEVPPVSVSAFLIQQIAAIRSDQWVALSEVSKSLKVQSAITATHQKFANVYSTLMDWLPAPAESDEVIEMIASSIDAWHHASTQSLFKATQPVASVDAPGDWNWSSSNTIVFVLPEATEDTKSQLTINKRLEQSGMDEREDEYWQYYEDCDYWNVDFKANQVEVASSEDRQNIPAPTALTLYAVVKLGLKIVEQAREVNW
ncbi:MAG: hypothetical protein AAFN77_17250 [Planctomycetota bacterium]